MGCLIAYWEELRLSQKGRDQKLRAQPVFSLLRPLTEP
jgi:hypothetical protein